jgi:hypothetical protein
VNGNGDDAVAEHVVDTSKLVEDSDDLSKTRVFLQKATMNMGKDEAKRFVEGLPFRVTPTIRSAMQMAIASI